MEREYCQKNFGNTMITIDKTGHICITDSWFTNWGIIYNFSIQDFKNGVINPCTGYPIQIIGMDGNIYSDRQKNWIYDKIKKGYFNHLIPIEK